MHPYIDEILPLTILLLHLGHFLLDLTANLSLPLLRSDLRLIVCYRRCEVAIVGPQLER